MRKSKNKKRNRKLIFQTLLMTAGLFIVVVILLISMSTYYSYKIYLSSREELLVSFLRQLRLVTTVYHPMTYYMDRWEEDIDSIGETESKSDVDKGNTLFNKILQKESVRIYGEDYDLSGLTITDQIEAAQLITREMLESLPEKEQVQLTRAAYNNLFNVYIEYILDHDKFNELCCIRIDGEDDSCMVVGGYKETGSLDSCLTYMYGEAIPEYFLEQKTIQSLISGTDVFKDKTEVFEVQSNHETGQELYYGYIPVTEDGKTVAIVCVSYDFSGFGDIMQTFYRKIILYLFLGLLVYSVLLILFLFRSAIHPLSVVTSGIKTYMSDKDSEKAQEMMSGVTTRNEVGELADSFGALVAEIDAYTKESLRINSEKERENAEMALAARIQQEALPHVFPDNKEFSLAASMTPARVVGGDFYDFFFIDENHLGLVIADVSDKGIPAALFMMMSKDMIKNYTMAGGSPSQVLKRVNRNLSENNKNGMFVTVWLGVLEISTGILTAVNAGHEYPMLRRAGRPFELIKDTHGTMIGYFAEREYKDYILQMKEGDTLFLYTDGAAEATSPDGELFGTTRMLKELNVDPDRSPDELIAGMKNAVDAFSAEAGQFDDLTMLSVCYHGRK